MAALLPSSGGKRLATIVIPLIPASSFASTSSTRLFSSTPRTSGKSRPGEGKDALRAARRAARLGGNSSSKQDDAYQLTDAFNLLKAVEVNRPRSAFEIHIVTSISSHQTNALRGRITFPRSPSLKPPKLLIFAEDGSPASLAARAAKQAGANIQVGGISLVEAVAENRAKPFDKVLAEPGLMSAVSRSLARSLGPRGLMPNVKRGTVAETQEGMRRAIDEAMGGTDWRGDKQAVIRAAIGRINFTEDQLRSNLRAMLASVLQRAGSGLAGGGASAAAKAAGSGNTGTYKVPQRAEGTPPPADLVKRASKLIKGMHLSSTQGPGIRLELMDVL